MDGITCIDYEIALPEAIDVVRALRMDDQKWHDALTCLYVESVLRELDLFDAWKNGDEAKEKQIRYCIARTERRASMAQSMLKSLQAH
jgi:hypothetical protein